MSCLRFATLTFTALATFALGAHADTKLQVHWQGKSAPAATLPSAFPSAARDAVKFWEPWCLRAGYEPWVETNGRSITIAQKGTSRGDALQALVTKTARWFDARLPAPDRNALAATTDGAALPKASPDDEIPEDPEGPPPNAPTTKTPPTSAPAANAKGWGQGSLEPDTATAVLFVVHDLDDYTSLLDFLGKERAYLRGWIEEAKQEVGFTLEDPLCAAYIENAPGMEEWSPDHELINRTAQLLMLRRFGQENFWLQLGVAWAAEWAHDGALYCFPYRKEFVGVGEHSAWFADLKNILGTRDTKSLDLAEFGTWKRGQWNERAARFAFGMASFLVSQDPTKTSAALEELRRFRDVDNRKDRGGGKFDRDPYYEAPAAKQAQIFRKHFGDSVLERAFEWLRKEPGVPSANDKKGAVGGKGSPR